MISAVWFVINLGLVAAVFYVFGRICTASLTKEPSDGPPLV